MNWGNRAIVVWEIAVVLLFTGMGCRREAPLPEHPLRKQAIGSWVAGRPGGNAPFATLDFNSDGTFMYEFHVGSKPPMKLTGDWTIEDQALIGQVKVAENAAYKAGDSFPFGEVVLLDDNTMKLRKQSSVDEYHRLPAEAKAGR